MAEAPVGKKRCFENQNKALKDSGHKVYVIKNTFGRIGEGQDNLVA